MCILKAVGGAEESLSSQATHKPRRISSKSLLSPANPHAAINPVKKPESEQAWAWGGGDYTGGGSGEAQVRRGVSGGGAPREGASC